MIRLPTLLSPVKFVLRTRGWVTMASPTSLPGPVTMFTTPAGMPASTQYSASFSTVSGAQEAGFRMQQLPVMSAGASLLTAVTKGKFQGVMRPTTP